MVDSSYFDEDYFKHGIESGKSCYFNYSWLPELTIPMAMTIIDLLNIKQGQRILDIGCAFGFLVKAMRLLHRDAYGVDVSRYALDNTDAMVKEFCCHIDDMPRRWFDFVIAKDVFEHIEIETLTSLLKTINGKKLFAVVPLGENGKYRAPANDFDSSHVVCQPEDWWVDLFNKCQWELKSFSFKVEGIKDSYYDKYPEAHGFFLLRNERWTSL